MEPAKSKQVTGIVMFVNVWNESRALQKTDSWKY